jgi:hypothetical protein
MSGQQAFGSARHRLEPGWFRSRLKAAAVHLGISAAIIALVCTAMALTWYPWPIFLAAGGSGLLLLVLLCDVVLGPSLTLVVYKQGKPSLKFDLALIAIMQLAALGFGLYSMYWARPVYTLFVVDRFELVSAADLEPEQLALAQPQFQDLSLRGPRLAAAQGPEDQDERERLMLAAISGIDLRHLPRYYVDYDRLRSQVLAKAQPLQRLNDFNDAGAVRRMIAGLSRRADEVKFLPLTGKKSDLVALVDARTGDYIGAVDLKPWL